MSDTLAYVENQVLSFSLAEQIHLLNFVANSINKQTSILTKENFEEESLKRMRESSLAGVWESVKNDSW